MNQKLSISRGCYFPASSPGLSIPYCIQKSRRKTWMLSLETDGSLVIKVPLSISFSMALELLQTKERWILKKYREWEAQQAHMPKSGLTPAQQKALESRYRQAAREYFPTRVSYYEKLLSVDHARITIRDQKTRWGSCSSQGNLNFNWRLMLAPPRVLDYVIVHELCHRKEMNHSKAFWNAVEMILPDYKELRKWLRDNGRTLRL